MPEGSQPLRLALARTLPFDSLFTLSSLIPIASSPKTLLQPLTLNLEPPCSCGTAIPGCALLTFRCELCFPDGVTGGVQFERSVEKFLKEEKGD